MGKVDRQHIQVALVALGYGVSLMNGTLDRGARDKIAAWQKTRNQPATGFLTGPQYQALLQEAAPAVSKFDDEQKKFEEERKKAATRRKGQRRCFLARPEPRLAASGQADACGNCANSR